MADGMGRCSWPTNIMQTNHQGLPIRKRIRLKIDYRTAGAYFITICVAKRQCLLGTIDNGRVILTDVGDIVQKTWTEIPNLFFRASLDTFIIMPNHIHGIIRLHEHDTGTGHSIGTGHDKSWPYDDGKTIRWGPDLYRKSFVGSRGKHHLRSTR